ncbi:MAG TPA: hypothetical protein C5S37_03675 [Methanophagales archaeon]|nr:hypothetical protein [Methanophagales archaeon]
MIDRTVQMLHALTLSWNEISGVASTTLCHGNKTAARYRKGYEMLERYEGKLSRTVLRRGGASNRPSLVCLNRRRLYVLYNEKKMVLVSS